MSTPMESGRAVSVLVVDDEPDVAESTAVLLAMHGCETRAVNGGEEALEALADAAPDVVLFDLRMPGMDGYELARRIREQAGVVRPLLVAVTACGSEEDRRRCLEAGIDLHLVKPVDPGVLMGLIRRFCRIFATARVG